MAISTLLLDLETKSDVDLTKSGVYRYADSPYFDILLFAYSVDDSPVKVIDLASGESLPHDILHALTDDSVTKHSFNASFERVCLSVWLKRNYPDIFHSYSIPQDSVGNYLSPDSWHCSMAASAYLGLPLTLAGVGSVLKLEQQKMTEGKALIKYFCVPYAYDGDKPLFHVPSDAPDKWAVFKAYNKRDVETEMGIERKISRFPVPYFVWKEYHLDQEINDRGIQLDLPLVHNAIRIGDCAKQHLTEKLCELTGLENPNSVQQMKGWLKSHGVEIESLGKKEVQELEQEKENLTAENEGLISQIADARADIKLLEEEKIQFQKDKETAEKRAGKAEMELKKLEDRREFLQPVMDNVSKEIKEYGMIKTFLPEATALERAVTYRDKKIKPLFIEMKNKIGAMAAQVKELTRERDSWKSKFQKKKQEHEKTKKELAEVQKDYQKLSGEKEILQGIADRYNRLLRMLGKDMVERLVQDDIRMQTELEAKKRKEQMPKKIGDRIQWARERSEEHNAKIKKNKAKYGGMEL